MQTTVCEEHFVRLGSTSPIVFWFMNSFVICMVHAIWFMRSLVMTSRVIWLRNSLVV